MRCRLLAFPLLASVGVCLLGFAAIAAAQQSNRDTFEIRGTVTNAANGQPIAGALVQMAGDRAEFSNSDGVFAFSEIPRGGYLVTAKKPGFFNDQELARSSAWSSSWKEVPSDGDLIVKLTPEGIIYGEVTNQSGQPLERITIRAQAWRLNNGRRYLQTAAQTITDDQGKFRLPELRPGNYYLLFQQVDQGGMSYSGLSSTKRKQQNQGFGLQFYPGVADLTSATLIPIRPGDQLHVPQILSPLTLFQVRGRVVGTNLEGGFSLNMMNGSGDNVQTGMHVDPKTGDFQIRGVPAGNYLLSVMVFHRFADDPGPDRPRRAWLPLSVTSDISGVVLPLGHGISLGVELRDETSSVETNGFHQVSIQMTAQDFAQFSAGTMAPTRLENGQMVPGKLEDLTPATYSVEAAAQFPGYVAGLRCGDVDLLRDDLVIGPNADPRPIEVTIRDDGAELSGTVTEVNQPVGSGIVIFSRDYPKRSILTRADRGSFSLQNVPPGNYLVFASEDASDLEFRNPNAVEQYLSHATSVTLGPRDKAKIQLQIYKAEEQP